MIKSSGIIALMTVKGWSVNSAQKTNDEHAALATELTR
jgi:hypothetical protein